MGKLTLQSEDLSLESFSASNFQTNQFEGNLLENDSITYNKLVDLTIDSDNLAEDSVLAENIADSSMQKRHFKPSALQSSHLADDVVTTRTLGSSAITSTELAELCVSILVRASSRVGAKIAMGRSVDMYEDPLTQRIDATLSAIRNLASASATNSQLLLDTGALDVCVACLAVLGAEQRFYEGGLGALINLTHNKPILISRLGDMGVCEMCIDGLNACMID